MNNNKRVILINGDGSKWYEQAIFIIKEEEKNIPKNIVFEAEKIINDYVNKKYNKSNYNYIENKKEIEKRNINNVQSKNLKNQPKNLNKKNNKKIKNCLNLIIFSTICVIFYLAYLIWF